MSARLGPPGGPSAWSWALGSPGVSSKFNYSHTHSTLTQRIIMSRTYRHYLSIEYAPVWLYIGYVALLLLVCALWCS